MKYLKTYLGTGLFLISLCLHGQDKVYYKRNKVDDWKVTEITPGYIKGTDVKNPQVSYSSSISNVMLVFNNVGDYLVIAGLEDVQTKATGGVQRFLHRKSAVQLSDRIITVTNKIIPCKVEIEQDKSIGYVADGKRLEIPKAEIVVIIFKNGNHKLFANLEKACKILRRMQHEYYQVASSPVKPQNPGPDPANVTGGAKTNVADTSTIQPEKKSIIITASVAESFKELDAKAMVKLQGKAISNIKDLESYIKIISDRQSDADQITKAISQSVSLFASEDSWVEVSSKNRAEAQQYKVRVYLTRLGLMKYNKVIIEWYNVQYASKVRKNPDGTYTGFIEFEQRFTGIAGDKKIYQDITRKTIEILLKSYYKQSDGESKLEWDVFLGNIGLSISKI